MKTKWKTAVFSCFLSLYISSTHAITITADTSISNSSTSTSDSGVPSVGTGGILEVSASSTLDASEANAFANEGGGIFVNGRGKSGAEANWDVQSIATWSNSYTNSTGSTQNWRFSFNVAPLFLGITGNPANFPIAGLETGIGIDITLDGLSIWNGSIALAGTTAVFTETGNSLGSASSSNPNPNSTVYTTGGISDVALFSIDPFSSVDLKYTMTGYSTGSLTAAELPFCETLLFDSCVAIYNLRDPFEANIAINSVSQVPLPGALYLLGSGLLGLIGISRSKKTA